MFNSLKNFIRMSQVGRIGNESNDFLKLSIKHLANIRCIAPNFYAIGETWKYKRMIEL